MKPPFTKEEFYRHEELMKRVTELTEKEFNELSYLNNKWDRFFRPIHPYVLQKVFMEVMLGIDPRDMIREGDDTIKRCLECQEDHR